MNLERQKACEVFFDLLVAGEPRIKTLEAWFFDVTQTIERWYLSEKDNGVKRAKQALNAGWLAILGEEVPVIPFIKSTQGIPDLVRPLVDRVRSCTYDSSLLSAALSLTRITDLWKSQPTDKVVGQSLDVISKSSLPKSALPVLQEFDSFVVLFLEAFPSHPVVRAMKHTLKLSDENGVVYRMSKGPNGALTINAHKDVKTLSQSPVKDGRSLLEATTCLEQAICDISAFSFSPEVGFANAVRQWEGFDELKCSETPGKLTVIPEKGGKVRVVAQPDYFSQRALKPIHDWLMRILQSFETDCTFDQRSAVPKISQWQTEGRYIASFDQSSCTDLFPFEMQLLVLKNTLGVPVTESVRTVMSDRDWSIKLPSGLTRKIRWSVGQPMGMFASWPLMALTHHLLVQYCYWKSSGRKFSKRPYSNYVICGDDIVVADKSVAELYLKTVKSLGMKVNVAKSHISGQGTGIEPVSEFAKITVWKGQPLYPIRPNMVLSSIKDWRQVVPLIVSIANHPGFGIKYRKLEKLVRKHYSKGCKFLIPLLTIPRELGGCGYRDGVSLSKRFTHLKTNQINPMLYFIGSWISSQISTESRRMELALEAICSLDRDSISLHPLKKYEKLNELQSLYYLNEKATVPQICKEIVEDGFGTYGRFLEHPATALPNISAESSNDEDLMKMRTLWEKALKKAYFYPERPDLGLKPVAEYSKLTVYGIYLRSSVNSDENLRQSEMDVISHYMLLVRSQKSNS